MFTRFGKWYKNTEEQIQNKNKKENRRTKQNNTSDDPKKEVALNLFLVTWCRIDL